MSDDFDFKPESHDDFGFEPEVDDKDKYENLKQLGKDLVDRYLGAHEAALHGITGFTAPITGLVPAALSSINNLGQGKPADFENEYGNKMQDLTYQPKTDAGGDFAGATDEFANRNLIPIAPLMHLQGTAMSVKGEQFGRNIEPPKAGKVSIEELKAAQAQAEAAKQTAAKQVSPDQAGAGAFDEIAGQLQAGQHSPIDFQPEPQIDLGKMMIEDQQRRAQQAAQEQLEARQAAMEQEVKQRTTLDLNAAERARQEQAPVLPNHDQEVAGDAAMANTADRLGDPRDGQNARLSSDIGNDPINVDPQGQAFRGDPNDPGARAGLESQTSSLDTELTHLRGKGTPEGEPLRPLQDHELNAVREQARDAMSELSPAEQKAIDFSNKPIKSNGKFSKQRGAVDLAPMRDIVKSAFDKIDEMMKRVDIPHALAKDAIPTMKELYQKHGDPQIISFARKELKQLGYPYDVLNAFDQAITAAHRLKLGETENSIAGSNVIPFKPRTPGNKQTGGILFNSPVRRTILDDIKDRYKAEGDQRYGAIPKDPDVADIIKSARNEDGDGHGLNYAEAGSILTAMKRGSSALEGAHRIIQNADKRGDYNVRTFIDPVERSIKSLSKSEYSTLWHGVLKEELIKDTKYDPAVLSRLSPKLQAAYAHMRRMFDDTLKIQNEQRRSEGKEEITPLEAYVASRWTGDFRRPIFQAVLDKHGNPMFDETGEPQKKLVWYLSGNTKFDVARQTKALLKDHPDLGFDPKWDHRVKYYTKKTDMQSAYTRALDVLGRDDPAVKKLKEAAENEMTNQSANFLNQQKHFEPKSGVRGFVGDRPGKSDAAEALHGIQQQINYGRNAYRWAAMQMAGDGIKQIVNDPVLAMKQPNNMKYIKEYYKNALGYGEAPAIAHLTDSIRELGFSPSMIGNAIAASKSFFILQKLALNTKTAFMHGLQSLNIMPHLSDSFFRHGGHDPISSFAVGLPAGLALASKHYADFFMGKGPHDVNLSSADIGFFKRAFKYAEDNMVASHTIYNEAPIEDHFSIAGKVANGLGHTMGLVETTSRAVAFMSFVHSLRKSPAYKSESALFQKAEELTYAAMGDYRSHEKALGFHKGGAFGNFLNTLQTYPLNQIHQWNYFGRQAAKGNIAPLLTAFAVQYAMAGIMGLPGMDDMDKIYMFAKNHIISTPLYAQAQKSEFWSDPKLWMLHHWGSDAVDGWVSAKSGMGISSSLRSVMPSDMFRAPGAPAVDLYKQGKNLVDAALHPTDKTKLAQFAMGSLPSGAPQGNFEQSKAMEGTTWNKRINNATGQEEHVYGRPGDIESREGVIVRTPQEENLRRFGIRSERETQERDIGYRLSETEKATNERAKGIIDPMWDALRRGDKQKVSDLMKAHIELTGKPISEQMFADKSLKEFTTNSERAATKSTSVTAIMQTAKMMRLLDDVRKEQGYGNKP